jgi:DNA segregation ATPase FtsK/SpoIIIE, S-DNA-T family
MQSNSRQGPSLLLVAVGAVALVLIGRVVIVAVIPFVVPALFVVAGLLAAVLVAAVVRFARLSPAARRNWPRAFLARLRWRWLTRNLGLAYVDQHGRRKIGRASAADPKRSHVRHPRARFRADPYGVVATVRTIPRAGRIEFEKAAQHLADEWGCTRVQVSQPKPGRLIVRGLLTDPLAAALSQADAPAGTYSQPAPFRPYLGRDEWGIDRSADLSGITGITIGGLPGYGKTSLVLSLLCQLAGSPAVQFAFIDMKGGGDYRDWRDRAWLHCGDELAAASGVLEDVHGLMRSRLADVAQGGPRNRWHVGPTPDYPLIVTVIDECHGAFDLDAVKSDKQAEAHVRACRALSGQLIKKGRSVLFLTILLTQKQTSDAIPTAIRDNAALGFSFAVKTRDAAVAGLGESIKEYPSYCPTTLRDRSMIGVATASLATGSDPFVRLRVPEVTEEAAAARATETAHHRADPATATVPVVAAVPAPVLAA